MRKRVQHSSARLIATLVVVAAMTVSAGELELRIVDAESGKPIGARVELSDARGRHPRIRKAAAFSDHFTVGGAAVLPLNGSYRFTVYSGPEYLEQTGSFIVERDATDNHTVKLKRFVNMSEKGWWSGDPWAARSPVDAPLLLLGEDLHLLGMPQPKDANGASRDVPDRTADLRGRAISTSGGRLHAWSDDNQQPVDAGLGDAWEQLTKDDDAAHLQLATPAAWDLPVWLATGNIDSILLHQPKTPRGFPDGRPLDAVRFPGQHGVGRYHESIYHHLLNAGLRIPPCASSLSGITSEPPGTYRTYVHLDGDFSASAWWDGLSAGRVMYTNGPLIIPTINGELPGHVFRAPAGGTVSLDTRLTLHTREKVDYLQFIKDGKSVREVRLDDWARANGKLQPMEFNESGWLIVRAVTNHGDTYRYAATAPYHIEIGDEPRISRKSVQFFADWLIERAKNLKSSNDPNRKAMLPHLRAAREFWQERLEAANAP